MSGVSTLHDALDKIQNGSTVKLRSEGVDDLRHVLRHNRASSTNIADATFNQLYTTLFQVAIQDISAWHKAKTSTTRTTAENKLSNCANALWLAIELGVPRLKAKTVRACAEHLMQNLLLSNGDLCTPLAYDYARALKTLLTTQAHVEHFSQEEWERAALFCLNTARLAEHGATDDDASASSTEQGTTAGHANRPSVRSSRSLFRDPTGSQSNSASLEKKVATELLDALSLLTAAPNAPVKERASELAVGLISILQNSSLQTCHLPAFATIKNVLGWIRVENVQVVRKITSNLIRLIRIFWSQTKASSSRDKESRGLQFKDDMIITLLYIRPYIFEALRTDNGIFRGELSRLLDVLRTRYGENMDNLDKNTLRLEDIDLSTTVTTSQVQGQINTFIFTLRSMNARAEQHWALVNLVAWLFKVLTPPDGNGDTSRQDGVEPHKKRQKVISGWEDLLSSVLLGASQSKESALQILTFLSEQQTFHTADLTKVLDSLITCCGDESASVANWAFLAATSCATQSDSGIVALSSRWTTLWQLASHSISNPSTCRASCYLLLTAIKLRLVNQNTVVDLIQALTSSMDQKGPAILADSSSQLLTHLIHSSQDISPSQTSFLAESVLRWVFRTVALNNFEGKHYSPTSSQCGVTDIVRLLSACLNQDNFLPVSNTMYVWDKVGQAILMCREQQETISYLLLLPADDSVWQKRLHDCHPATVKHTVSRPRISCEDVFLGQSIAEFQRARESWNVMQRDRPSGITSDMFRTLFTVGCSFALISHDLTFQNSESQAQLCSEVVELLQSLAQIVSDTGSDEEKLDTALMIFSQACLGSFGSASASSRSQSRGQKFLCHLIHGSLEARKGTRMSGTDYDSDDMDIDDQFDSQASRQSLKSVELADIKNDFTMLYSRTSLKACTSLFAAVISALEDEGREQNAEKPSARIVAHILSLPEPQFFAARYVLGSLPQVGVRFTPYETERLLDFCTTIVMNPYSFRRTETAMGTMLEIMSALLSIWADRNNKSVYDLGVDIYTWFTSTALSANVLSPKVQRKLASMLLEIFNVNTAFGKDQTDVPEVSASLFKIIEVGPVEVNFFIAKRVSSVFELFTRSEHGRLFLDITACLPGDETQAEGMAIRLLFFAQLGAAWHSVLRQSVYYIFETAGKVPTARHHAAQCVMTLTESLGFSSPRKLFRLFCPQLMYTWLEKQALTQLPYSCFEYATLEDLLEQNQIEIFAQVMAQNSEQDLTILTNACNVSRSQLTKSSFARAMAYALSWDVDESKPATNVKPRETRIQEFIGTKAMLATLCQQQFPTIVGYLYLTVKLERPESVDLEQKPDYSMAAAAIKEMKRYGYSVQVLPPNQQPSFRADKFLSRIDRLCRRVSLSPQTPWTTSTFALTVRVLLDSVDSPLGALQICVMLRRMRILVSTAGQLALEGFPLEMLLHSLRPFLSLEDCADDTLGILKYLLNHGEAYLKTNIPFTVGNIMLMVLQVCQYSRQLQGNIAQEDQNQQTRKRMHGFRMWLVEYLRRVSENADTDGPRIPDQLLEALVGVKLPGNAIKGSPESLILELILEQICSSKPLWTLSDTLEALSILSRDFVAPGSISENCLGVSKDAAEYSDSVFTILSAGEWDTGFLLWQAAVLGRAYAATGKLPQRVESDVSRLIVHQTEIPSNLMSEYRISQRVSGLVLSKNRTEAGIADHVLRRVFDELTQVNDAEEMNTFKQMLLPPGLVDALQNGCQGYYSPSVSDHTSDVEECQSVQEALAVSVDMPDEQWTRILAIALCKDSSGFSSLLKALPIALVAIQGLAAELLPQIVHIVLLKDERSGLPQSLSASMMSHFKLPSGCLEKRQSLLIQIVLYLRGQSYPGETNRTARLRWLDIDLLAAASAAAACGMGTAALLLAESAQPVNIEGPRRSSSRASLSQTVSSVQVPEDLLLSVFKQIDEPDSFYGVMQPASLESVLARLDYEKDGYRGLMFRSARMDAAMRAEHRFVTNDSLGIIRSLSALNFNSLNYALMSGKIGESVDCSLEMLDAARKLQQWDLSAPQKAPLGSAACFAALQHLSRATDVPSTKARLRLILIDQVRPNAIPNPKGRSIWCSTLATLAEIDRIINMSDEDNLHSYWEELLAYQDWMKMAAFEDCHTIVSNRQTLFSVLASNKSLSRALQAGVKTCRLLEAKSIMELSRYSRSHDKLQEALSAANQLNLLSNRSHELGLTVGAAAKMETALVFWHTGEITASVRILRDILDLTNIETESIPVGRSGLLAQLGYQLAEARLEKPEEIMKTCLEPAIQHLRQRKDGIEAGNVFHEYASFCDRQLQNPALLEEMERIDAMRQEKATEKKELELMYQQKKNSSDLPQGFRHTYDKVKRWLKIDEDEHNRLKTNRDTFVEKSLHYYMLALQASDEHNISALRFFALWLDNAELLEANDVVQEHLPGVPSWKFVLLLNQLMSRLEKVESTFQSSLQHLVMRMCAEHPFHSLHHLYASTRKGYSKSAIVKSRVDAASAIRMALQSQSESKDLLVRFFKVNNEYQKLAQSKPPHSKNVKVPMKDFVVAKEVTAGVLAFKLPPATVHLSLRPDGNYGDVPILKRWAPTVSIMGGVSAPKAISAYASDGREYKQLFKGGNDDLRQDAIMEQVFEEVSKMLGNHKETRQRNLHVRTYKVIPLSQTSGIIEFVPNSVPLDEYLQPAHRRYHPEDMTSNEARSKISQNQSKSADARVKEFRKICERIHPVLRHFFFERFDDPDDWFQKRTAYTRTTAANSMMGYVIGLGDRHNSNILLDEKTGEAVHIDLGISFEAGKVLPVPETVPFRLTRDIVDAMGATKTEGVFRRCCEFTMNALRDDRDSIMTLLNVLRYDPLHSWTVSPVRAKRLQNASETNQPNGSKAVDEHSSKKKEQEAADADRALAAVEKKLAKTLSTAATVSELIQQATDEQNLGLLFTGWAAFF